MTVSKWSTTAGDNATADPTINWAENQAPSTVNNSSRAEMAAIRAWYEDVEYRDWGHTVTRTGNTTFTVATDVTAIYVANRPIRCADSSTLYGFIASSSYSAPNTTVTVTLDSGNLSASLTAVALGVTPSTKSIPVDAVRNGGSALLSAANTWAATQTFSAAINQAKGADIADSATPAIGAAAGNTVVLNGTTTITAFDTVQAGTQRTVIFAGARTLTHNATSLILPTGANITTAANDTADFVSLGSGNWRLTNYEKANGTPLVSINANVQSFDSSGTWTKPNGYSASSRALIQAWGPGGSGGTGVSDRGGGGGGGGAYVERWMYLSELGSTETVTLGTPGASVSGDDVAGNSGGNTTFGSHVTAYGGGGGGRRSGGGGVGAGGGGLASAGTTGADGTTGANGGNPAGGAGGVGGSPGAASTFGGGGGGGQSAQAGGYSVYGGGGGGSGNAGANGGSGGGSYMGGGGGGGGASSTGNTGVGGTSIGGGNGGQGNTTDTGNATAGTQPGGGGGGSYTGNSGAGGAGRVIVTVFGA